MSYFHYKIIAKGEKKYEGKDICFGTLHCYKEETDLKVVYTLTYTQKKEIPCFTDEEILEFHNAANSWGFELDYEKTPEGKHVFTNTRKDTYISLLAPLIIRRYLEEIGFVNIVKSWFQLKKNNPDISTFTLFQLAHFYPYEGENNCNLQVHSLMRDINNIYNQNPIPRIATPDNVRENLKTITKGSGDSPYGVFNVILDSKNPNSAVKGPLGEDYPITDIKKLVAALS